MARKKATVRITGRPTRAQAAQIEERLREAAVDVFIENGFEATTMEAVAAATGITKRTLYARYVDKNALFTDAVNWAVARYHASELPEETGAGDLAEGLLAIGLAMLTRARDPDVVRLNRMIIIEAARIPAFSTRAYSTAWSPRVKAVMSLLAKHKKAGTVVVEDVEIAAELFISMVGQRPAWLSALGATRPLELEELYTRHAVKLFLRSIRQPRSRAKPSKAKA